MLPNAAVLATLQSCIVRGVQMQLTEGMAMFRTMGLADLEGAKGV